jgi:hypothetical protein
MTKQLTEAEVMARYGRPSQRGDYLSPVALPFPLRVAWAPKTLVRSLRCHHLETGRLAAIFADILAHYGPTRIRELGIDLFGGCFSYRRMALHAVRPVTATSWLTRAVAVPMAEVRLRPENAWSRHAWGIAVDLDPDRNGLRMDHTRAQFARPEYAAMIDAFEAHGWLSLGRRLDLDWMHFEAGLIVPETAVSSPPNGDSPFGF